MAEQSHVLDPERSLVEPAIEKTKAELAGGAAYLQGNPVTQLVRNKKVAIAFVPVDKLGLENIDAIGRRSGRSISSQREGGIEERIVVLEQHLALERMESVGR